MLGAGALGQPRGRVWGGRREEGSGWGTHVYLWWIKKKLKEKKKEKKKTKKNPNILMPGLQVGSVGKEPGCNAGDIRDVGSVSGLGRSPGEGHGKPL